MAEARVVASRSRAWWALPIVSVALNIALLWLAVALFHATPLAPKISPDLTAAGLMQIAIGDSCGSVVRRVGYPLDLDWGGVRGPANEVGNEWPTRYVWTYAHPGALDELEVRVGIADCKVIYVAVQRRDRRIYYLNGAQKKRVGATEETLRSMIGR